MKKASVPLPVKRLYLVHGWAYSLKPWRELRTALGRRGVEVVPLKVPGLTAKSSRVWTVETYLDWLDKQLTGVRQPVVLGHSNGGRLLLNYCLRHPGKLRHLILLSSAGIPPTPAAQRRRAFLASAAKMAGLFRRVSVLRRLVYRLLGSSDYNAAPANMKKTLRNLLASDERLPSRLAEIKTPISIIWGEADRVTPLAQAAELRRRLSNVCHFETIADAGHAPYVSSPRQLEEAIVKILASL